MSKGFDITKVKQEIDQRKSNNANRSKILGENTPVPVAGDKFLAELVYSRNNGVKTGASAKVAAVAQVAEAKAKGKSINTQEVTKNLLEHVNTPKKQNVVAKVPNNMGMNDASSKAEEKRRIAELAEQMERQDKVRGNQTLADVMSQYQNIPNVGSPMQNNGYLTEAQMKQAMGQGGQQPMIGGNMNNGMIVEQVNNVAQEFLTENFGSLFSQALKSSIVETYKADRVKEAINENRDLIKEIVVETILELQKRSQNSKKA